MPPKFDRKREVDRYFALTLNLEDALRSEKWEEAGVLFGERERSLLRLKAEKVVLTQSEVQKIQVAEARALSFLHQMKSAVTGEIRINVTRDAANRAYIGAGRRTMGFSQAS